MLKTCEQGHPYRHRKYRQSAKGRETQKRWWYWKHYRLTLEAFEALWEKAEGKCPVCSIPMERQSRAGTAACVDHDHQTGKVRGIVCRKCNNRFLGTGSAEHLALLKRAVLYLERQC